MGVESIELDTVNLRMVARTLPGKQFDVGRQLRVLVIAALMRAGIASPVDSSPVVEAIVHPATAGGAEENPGAGDAEMKLTPKRREGRGWPHYILWGRVRTSTAVLLVAFIAVWWLYATYQPAAPAPEAPATQMVPPGFIPDPSYTWVPRTEVRDGPRPPGRRRRRPRRRRRRLSRARRRRPRRRPRHRRRRRRTTPVAPGTAADTRAADADTDAHSVTGAGAGADGHARGSDAVTGHSRRTATLACRDDHP